VAGWFTLAPLVILLLTYYPEAINLVNSLQKDFYVHLTISQPTLKEPTPGSLNATWTKSE
jgi:hypothetical protein